LKDIFIADALKLESTGISPSFCIFNTKRETWDNYCFGIAMPYRIYKKEEGWLEISVFCNVHRKCHEGF